MSVAIVIPARWASTRLPEKILLAETGWPLIRHTYEQAKKSRLAQTVLVATDDERVYQTVKQFGGDCVMTDPKHQSGTDRLAEVAAKHLKHVDVIVNVQGDEPEIEPSNIDLLIELFQSSNAAMATLVARFAPHLTQGPGSPLDPNCVKAVLGAPISAQNTLLGYEALYFSRSLVPYPREDAGKVLKPENYFLHLGVYAYTPHFLEGFSQLAQTPLELSEKLEQLRVLEQGHSIVAAVVANATPGIDSRADYDAFLARFKERMPENAL